MILQIELEVFHVFENAMDLCVKKLIIGMRPRWIYATTFLWSATSGGRFSAPFLQTVAGFDDFEIGIALATQLILISCCLTPAGIFADWFEQKVHGSGRALVMGLGLSIGTIAILMHSYAYEGDHKFLWYLFLRMLYALGLSLTQVLDGLTLAHLENEGSHSSEYGKERLHGALWWAIGSILLGYSVEILGFTAVYFWSSFSYIVSIAALLLYIAAQKRQRIPQRNEEFSCEYGSLQSNINSIEVEKREEAQKNYESSSTFIEVFWLIFGSVFGMGFLLSCITLFIGFSVTENLIFLFFESLGASWTMCGFSVLVTVVLELPIFHYSQYLLNEFGVASLQLIACTCYVVRVVGYGFVPKQHSYWILLLEQLHGITYGCFRIAGVEYVGQTCPNGLEATGQGILNTATGIGSVFGLLLGSYVEGKYGDISMYRVLAGIVVFGTVVLIVTNHHAKAYR